MKTGWATGPGRSAGSVARPPHGYGARVLAEPGHALTDLVLGIVAVSLALGLRGSPAVTRHWRSALWWFGVAALAGAVHHGLIVRWPDVARPSWAFISLLVVVAVSFLLAGTVHDVLGGRRPGRSGCSARSGSWPTS